MHERGAALPEALVTLGIVAMVGAAALAALAELPGSAVAWEEQAGARQRVRLIDTRIGGAVMSAAPIEVQVEGVTVRLAAVLPRRAGLLRADSPDVVSPAAVSVLTRYDTHRVLRVTEDFAGSPVEVRTAPGDGCGSDAMCAIRAGDAVMAIAAGGEYGLFRVQAAATRLRLEALSNHVTAFAAGAVIVPIEIAVFEFDRAEDAIRKYDGYRSDNVLLDGVAAAEWEVRDGASGLLVSLTVTVAAPAAQRPISFVWRPRTWR